MSANHRAYEDHLEYFPEKERNALEEAFFVEKDVENAVNSAIRQLNRSKTFETKTPKQA
jgi:hypothetical protein